MTTLKCWFIAEEGLNKRSWVGYYICAVMDISQGYMLFSWSERGLTHPIKITISLSVSTSLIVVKKIINTSQ